LSGNTGTGAADDYFLSGGTVAQAGSGGYPVGQQSVNSIVQI